jgi:hypothetical protein
MKTIILILFTCFVLVAKIYAQSTDITLYVLESKDKNWQGIKLHDKRHSKLSLASKLLQANKEGKIQAYSYKEKQKLSVVYDEKQDTIVSIDYGKVAKNLELPVYNVGEPCSNDEFETFSDNEFGSDTITENNLAFSVVYKNYFIKDIKGANIITIQGNKYLSLILPSNVRPSGVEFIVAMYQITDVEKLLNHKITFQYSLCKLYDTCNACEVCETCNFEDDENTDKEFVANPSIPEFEYGKENE